MTMAVIGGTVICNFIMKGQPLLVMMAACRGKGSDEALAAASGALLRMYQEVCDQELQSSQICLQVRAAALLAPTSSHAPLTLSNHTCLPSPVLPFQSHLDG